MKYKALIAGVLGLAALSGAGAWGVTAVGDADRTAPTRYWRPAEARATSGPQPPKVPLNAVQQLLLPIPAGMRPGPDIGEDGSEYALSGAVAVERIKEQRRGLRAAERKQRDRILDRLELTGIAARSYTDPYGASAEVRITRADGKGLAELDRLSRRVLKAAADGKRKAPKVAGHPEAVCALIPVEWEEGSDGKEDKEDKGVESLVCTAHSEGTLVSFEAYAAAPFARLEPVVALLKDQLDRLKSPGESA